MARATSSSMWLWPLTRDIKACQTIGAPKRIAPTIAISSDWSLLGKMYSAIMLLTTRAPPISVANKRTLTRAVIDFV